MTTATCRSADDAWTVVVDLLKRQASSALLPGKAYRRTLTAISVGLSMLPRVPFRW